MSETKNRYNLRKRKISMPQLKVFYDENGNPYIWICCNDDDFSDDGIGCDYIGAHGIRCPNWTHYKHSGLDVNMIRRLKADYLGVIDFKFYCLPHKNVPSNKVRKLDKKVEESNENVTDIKENKEIEVMDCDKDASDIELDDLDEKQLKEYTQNIANKNRKIQQSIKENNGNKNDENKEIEFCDDDDTVIDDMNEKQLNIANKNKKTVPAPIISLHIGVQKPPRKDTLFDADREKAITNKAIEVGKLNCNQIAAAVDMLLENKQFVEWMSNELIVNAEDKIKSPLKKKKKSKGQGKGGGARAHWNDTFRMIYVQALCYVWKNAVKFKCSQDNGRSAAIVNKTNDVAMILFEKLGIKAVERSNKKVDEFFDNLENYKKKDKDFVVRYNTLKTNMDEKRRIVPNSAPGALANSIMSNLRKQNFTLHKKLQEIKDQQQEGDDGDMSDIKGCVKLITNKLLGNNTKNIISDDGKVSLLNTGNVTQSKNQLQNINQIQNANQLQNINQLKNETKNMSGTNNKCNIYEVDHVEKEFCMRLYDWQNSKEYDEVFMMKIQCALLDESKKTIILSRYNMYKPQIKDVKSLITTIKPVILAMESIANQK